MILTDRYFQARQEAMQWLGKQPERRNFAQGLRILVESGYKPTVQRLLERKGDLPWTREKLTSCLRDVVRIYYNPDDPRFGDTPDADVLNDSEGERPTIDEQRSIAESSQPGNKFDSMPEVMQLLVRNFADAYKQRARLSRQRYELGESNDAATVERRKQLGNEIDSLTAYMDTLAPLREQYEKDGTLPSMDAVKNAYSATAAAAAKTMEQAQAADATDYKNQPTDRLRTRRKSLTNQITRKENQLLYQSDTKQAEENPLPESPRRQKLLRQIENLRAEKSKVEYELAQRE